MLILGVSPHQDDVTTRAVRVALQPALETWKELGPSGRHHLAGLVVFHCALWRTFGTKEFIRKLGFLESLETWKEESWQQVVDVALSCWERGELCFTEAYCPSRLWRKWEVGAFRDPKGKERVGSLFQDLFFFFLFFQFFLRIALSISLFLSLSLYFPRFDIRTTETKYVKGKSASSPRKCVDLSSVAFGSIDSTSSGWLRVDALGDKWSKPSWRCHTMVAQAPFFASIVLKIFSIQKS